jgi:L-seryl-tRNA(Ser) seleniumtransferase
MNSDINFKNIPSVNILLENLILKFPRIKPIYLKRIINRKLDSVRNHPAKFGLHKHSKSEMTEMLSGQIIGEIEQLLSGSLRKVINATGVVLHTGMGRAPLNPNTIQALQSVGRYANLEIDTVSGRRGERLDHLSDLLIYLTGAEDALAVNNNAAAVMLMLNSVARRKEVILSRGEMIEIGGSFRLPEVMKISGCKLKEIGTTNKTHLADYEQAISEKTGAILICHTSNYEVQGFTHQPNIDEIVKVGEKYNLPVLYDLGSGSLIDTKIFGSDSEPEVSEIVEKGVDLVSFSGDKLLGGPQSGIIAGKAHFIKMCKKNHLLRALRLDKLIIKALQETLIQYLKEETTTNIDGIGALTTQAADLEQRCKRFMKKLPSNLTAKISLVQTTGKVGSGAYPTMELTSFAIRIEPQKISTNRLAVKLRSWSIPVFPYIAENALFVDLRTVSDSEEDTIISALKEYLQ